jgi:hypothetical protein
MALRRMLCAAAVVCTLGCALAACDDDKPKDKAAPPPAAKATPDLRAHCEQMAKTCSDSDKHIAALADECAASLGQASRCTAEGIAIYDCYQKELCGKSEKVWALEDLRKLADRHGVCNAERDALRACATK